MDQHKVKVRKEEANRKDTEVAGKAIGDKNADYKDKAEKHDGKDGAVLGDINDGAREHDASDGVESGDINNDTEEHGSKDGAVLGDMNKEAKKEKK